MAGAGRKDAPAGRIRPLLAVAALLIGPPLVLYVAAWMDWLAGSGGIVMLGIAWLAGIAAVLLIGLPRRGVVIGVILWTMVAIPTLPMIALVAVCLYGRCL